MASKNLFHSLLGALLPKPDAVNEEGAPAYAYTPRHKLAQLAATGCFHRTFYASGEKQLESVFESARQVEPAFVARAAVFARERGYMKDMPALLCVLLATLDRDLLRKVFPRVIDNGKMLRNFVQILRSGAAGRKSLGTVSKKLVREWLHTRGPEGIFRASVGQSPSLGDIVKMVHPKPRDPAEEAIFGWLIGKPFVAERLPELVQQFEAFKAKKTLEAPNVPFEMLTALELGRAEWAAIARNASWQQTRMNLNTFARHGVFDDPDLAQIVADRLSNEALITKARAFPYQILIAYETAAASIPQIVRNALNDAMEIAVSNVPALEGKVHVCVDVSGSMQSPVTGSRPGATTAVRCVDVAALFACSVLRKNRLAELIPFDNLVKPVMLNPRDSVLTNAKTLASIGGGGTCVSAPLKLLNDNGSTGDLVVIVSDNQSWVDARSPVGTETMRQWGAFRARNPKAKLVCIDLQPHGTTQAPERPDVLNVGGFSDHVFDVIREFATGQIDAGHWVGMIEKIEL